MDRSAICSLSRVVLVSGFAWLPACGGTSLLHGPVVDRCETSGLKGCDEIADGVVEVADGKKDEGLAKIEHGAGRNAPQDVREFADKLDTVSSLPGLGSFRPTLKEVATALRIAPGESSAGTAAGASALEAQQLVAVQDRSAPNARAAVQWRAGTAAPVADGDACETQLGTSSCERVLIGPAEITSLVAGGGCPSRLMIFAGDAQKPRWSIVVPASGTLTLATTSIPLEDSEGLGVATTSGGPIQAECAVTWVARRH